MKPARLFRETLLHKFFKKNSEFSKESGASFAIEMNDGGNLRPTSRILSQSLRRAQIIISEGFAENRFMKIQKRREIVIEFERLQVVRKKAETHLSLCRACGREVDFISLIEAASLFTTQVEKLLQFVRVNNSHVESGTNGEILLCLVSLLARMKARTNSSQIKMIED